jgi:hypothetical protein
MIKDANVLSDIRCEWETVRATREMVRSNVASGFVFSHGVLSAELGSIKLANSLLVLFAFSVLERVLLQLRSEGHFQSKNTMLGCLMAASQNVLPWKDYTFIDQAREKRNDIAHRRQWIGQAESQKYIDAIELELTSWTIV